MKIKNFVFKEWQWHWLCRLIEGIEGGHKLIPGSLALVLFIGLALLDLGEICLAGCRGDSQGLLLKQKKSSSSGHPFYSHNPLEIYVVQKKCGFRTMSYPRYTAWLNASIPPYIVAGAQSAWSYKILQTPGFILALCQVFTPVWSFLGHCHSEVSHFE